MPVSDSFEDYGYRTPKSNSIGVDAMQVCANGHKITEASLGMPEYAKKFCPDCGEPTFNHCECGARVPGTDWNSGVIGFDLGIPPKYCGECGVPYPWTKRRMEAADDLIAELEGLTSNEMDQLRLAVRDVAVDGARTELGVMRFRRLAAKASQTVGGSLYKIAVDIASDAAKKLILG